MKVSSAFFAIRVGQSLDNPREPALVIFVDRKKPASQLVQNAGGLRTRYVLMDRLYVTRSYAEPVPSTSHCGRRLERDESFEGNMPGFIEPRGLEFK